MMRAIWQRPSISSSACRSGRCRQVARLYGSGWPITNRIRVQLATDRGMTRRRRLTAVPRPIAVFVEGDGETIEPFDDPGDERLLERLALGVDDKDVLRGHRNVELPIRSGGSWNRRGAW